MLSFVVLTMALAVVAGKCSFGFIVNLRRLLSV